MDNSNYLSLFLEESKENLENISRNLLLLEKDSQDASIIDDIFRSAHTLKGMASTMGFNAMASLTHSMENVLDEVRKNKLFLSPAIIDLLLQCYDFLDLCLQDVELTGSEGERDASELKQGLLSFISDTQAEPVQEKEDKKGQAKAKDKQEEAQIVEHISDVDLDVYQKDIISESGQQGFNTFNIKIQLVSDCLLKSARAYIVFRELETLGEIVASNPSAEDIEEEQFGNTFSVILVTTSDVEAVKHVLDLVTELESVEITQISTETEKLVVNDIEVGKHQKASPQKKTTTSSKLGKSIRVDIDRLDSLMNLVSELIIVKNRIQSENSYEQDKNLLESVEYLGRVTTDLHEAVMKVRMVPVEIVFNRFPRIIRDLAKETHKSVELITEGSNTEVDRSIIDELSEPLIHLIRNSIDHGLETKEERIKNGKPETGYIYLRAYHEGNNVVIEVEDDGQGLDIDKIREKILKLDLASEETIKETDDNQVMSFIFEPGFTTSDAVTNISGRGVGLDVVKTKIEALGGIVDISTGKSKGTKFTIRLPLTLSIIKALLVKVSDEKYALPLGSIAEILEVESEQINKLKEQELIQYRGQLIPVIRLKKLLKTPEDNIREPDRLIMVIVKKGERHFGLVIDDLVGQQEIVIKSLGEYLADIQIVSGATILGDGSIALILDINHVA